MTGTLAPPSVTTKRTVPAVAHHRALLDEAAEPEALAVARRMRGELARAAEELDAVAHRVADEAGGRGEQHSARDAPSGSGVSSSGRRPCVLRHRFCGGSTPIRFSAALTSAPYMIVAPVR